MDTASNRFIAIDLTETEWHALRAVEPNPTAWVKQQITRRLADSGPLVGAAEGAEGKLRPADIRLRTI